MSETPKIIITNTDGDALNQDNIKSDDWVLLIVSTDNLKEVEAIVLNKQEQKDITHLDFVKEIVSLIESRLPNIRKGFVEHWNNLNDTKDEESFKKNGMDISVAGYVEKSDMYDLEETGFEGVNIINLRLLDSGVSYDSIQKEVKGLFKQTLDQIVEVENEQKDSNEYYKNPSKYVGVGNSDFISNKKRF